MPPRSNLKPDRVPISIDKGLSVEVLKGSKDPEEMLLAKAKLLQELNVCEVVGPPQRKSLG